MAKNDEISMITRYSALTRGKKNLVMKMSKKRKATNESL